MRRMENRYQFNAHCYLGQFTTMGLFLSKKLNLVSEVVISIEQIGNLVWTMVIPTLITQSGSEQENRDHCLCNRVLTLLSLTSQQNIIQMGPILADPQALCLYFAVSTSHRWGSERGTELFRVCLSHITRLMWNPLMANWTFQYPIRCLIVRSREVSKQWDWQFDLWHWFEIWQVQHSQAAVRISEWSNNSKHKFRGFETSLDLTVRRLIRYWNGGLGCLCCGAACT